jgi:hypothetical protein
MSYKITCFTLFDITHTGVINRSRPEVDADIDTWLYKRNTQCNFDTVQQAISLRSQPEIIRYPEKFNIKFNEFENFGFLFELETTELINCWSFDFDVQHPSVFTDSISELGSLYTDCHGIPMLKCGTEWEKLSNFLDTSEDLRNIYFVINKNEN